MSDLPEWAQKMVRAMDGCVGYGFLNPEAVGFGKHIADHVSHLLFRGDKAPQEWFEGISELFRSVYPPLSDEEDAPDD